MKAKIKRSDRTTLRKSYVKSIDLEEKQVYRASSESTEAREQDLNVRIKCLRQEWDGNRSGRDTEWLSRVRWRLGLGIWCQSLKAKNKEDTWQNSKNHGKNSWNWLVNLMPWDSTFVQQIVLGKTMHSKSHTACVTGPGCINYKTTTLD